MIRKPAPPKIPPPEIKGNYGAQNQILSQVLNKSNVSYPSQNPFAMGGLRKR